MSIVLIRRRFFFAVLILATQGMATAPSVLAESKPSGQITSAEESAQLRESAKDDDEQHSLSNFIKTVEEGGSAKSVQADLVSSDTIKPAIFPLDRVHPTLKHYYALREKTHESLGLAFTMDYSALIQRASWVQGDDRTGFSQAMRFLGKWLTFGKPESTAGSLVWKIEGRDNIGGHPTPRELGFDTGSALSTAGYKELDWGFTNLYWKQSFNNRAHSFLIGHLDPSDWVDQYPLLNPWNLFMNDAFFTNPAEAVPKQGFGIVYQAYFKQDMYFLGGVTDANGKGSELDVDSFWDEREWFSWAEIGFRANRDITALRNMHLHYWHQDAREGAGTAASWGLTYTYSAVLDNGAVPFVRIGYSEGDAAQLRQFIGVGIRLKVFGRDSLGVATSWGAPPDKSLRSQVTSEGFYRVQMTQNLTVSPSVQVTYKPSLTLEKDWIVVAGLRLRLVF